MRITRFFCLSLWVATVGLSLAACGGDDDDPVQMPDTGSNNSSGNSSSSGQDNVSKKIAQALIGTWVNAEELAAWRVYMSQSNIEKSSSLMDHAYNFKGGTGTYLYNRKGNTFTTWTGGDDYSWSIASCEKVSGHYEGFLSMTGSMSGKFEFQMSGDMKHLYFENEWLDKAPTY